MLWALLKLFAVPDKDVIVSIQNTDTDICDYANIFFVMRTEVRNEMKTDKFLGKLVILATVSTLFLRPEGNIFNRNKPELLIEKYPKSQKLGQEK